jgi:importin subunit beta-1
MTMDLNILSQNFSSILNGGLSADKKIRQEAENSLEYYATNNLSEFLYKLATELADESKPVPNRQLAATYFKNVITIPERLKEMWITLDSTIKDNIKLTVLSCLASNRKEIRRATGTVIAGICKVDLPISEKWPTLIESLCQNTFNENEDMRLAAIESLGYICEEMTVKTIDPATVDYILSALIQNIKNYISSQENVYSVLKALDHTIKLAKKNFTNLVNFIII